MVKGPARNAQYYFITEEVMPKYKYRSFMDALSHGRRLWKDLSEEKRAYYKRKEQDWKAFMRGPAGDKYRMTSSGTNVEEEKNEMLRKTEFEKKACQFALDYIDQAKDVMVQPFFFIAFEYALHDDNGKYYPCEVGLVKYSLERGIEKYVHYFLKPAEYPIGTKAAAKKHSEERHKIPYMGFEKSTDGYSAIFAHIRDVLLESSDGEQYPPIFCMPDDVEMNRKCLNDLFYRAQRHESERPGYVVSATILVRELYGQNKCGEANARELLLTHEYDHDKGVACDWHYDLECIHCALATARKIAFHVSDCMKTTYDLKITPNHLPTLTSNVNYDADFIPFENPAEDPWSNNSWDTKSDFSVRSSRNRQEKDYSTDSVISGFSQMSFSRGRGMVNDQPMMASGNYQLKNAAQAVTQRFPQQSTGAIWEDDDDDDTATWSTVSSRRPPIQDPPVNDDYGWSTVPSSRKPKKASSSTAWTSYSRNNDDDVDEWESGSFVSTTAQEPSSFGNPYVSKPSGGMGRGRGLYYK